MLINIFPIKPGEDSYFGLAVFITTLLLVAASFLINKVFIQFSQKLGTNNYTANTQDRWSKMPKPIVGGLSFFLIFLLAPQLGNIFGYSTLAGDHFLSLTIVATIGFFVGLQDDAYNTRPLLKFLGQLSCGVVMILFGTTINLTHNSLLDSFLTLFWVVGIMNSINMLDNMDGVTAIISATILAGVLVVNYFSGGSFRGMEWVLLASIAAIFGFLILNYHPSKLYMGDTGSQFLGAILAFVGVKYLWNTPMMNQNFTTVRQILYPVLIFLIPIMDTTFVSVARLRRGQSPFVGGKDHTTHHLHYLGINEKKIPLILSAITILSVVIVSVLQADENLFSLNLTLAIAFYLVIVVLGMLYCYQKGNHNQKKNIEPNAENSADNNTTLVNAILN